MDENKDFETHRAPAVPCYIAGKGEFLFGAVVLILSLALYNCLDYGFQLGFALCAAALIGCSWVYLRRSGKVIRPYPCSLLILSILLALGYGLNDTWNVKFFCFSLLIGAANLGLILAAGQNRRSPDGAGTLLDAPRALFVLGIGGMGRTISGLTLGIRCGGSTRKVGAVALGLLISLPIVLVLGNLLISADAAFEGIMAELPEIALSDTLETLLFGGLLAWVLYSRGVRLAKDLPPLSARRRAGRANTLTVNTVLIMVGLLYSVYLFSQLAYLSGGLAGILPAEFTLAEYARRGFFEMAWLCALNLGLLCGCMWLLRRDGALPLVTKIAGTFLGAVTIFLVITASAKMFLYIGSYGLTTMRILTEVFMLWLALTTVLVGIRLYKPNFAYMKAVVLAGLVLAVALSWVDVGTVCAEYNLSAYQSGKMDQIDTEYLGMLGDSGVPALVTLTQDADPEVAQAARELLPYKSYYKYMDLQSWNLVRARAAQAMEAYEP